MITYYAVTTLLVVVNFVLILFRYDGKKLNQYFMLIGLIMSIASGGYLALAVSINLEEAVLANKISYIGGCFLQPVVLLAICALCNYKIPPMLRNALFAFSFLVYGLILTAEKHDLYYTDAYIENQNGVTNLVHEYGVAYPLFYVILYGYIILEGILLFYCLYKKRTVSRKNLWALISLVGINIVLYAVFKALDISVQIMLLLYVIDGWIILYLQRRVILYNVEDCIMGSLEKQDSYGYLMFDRQRRYLGCNQAAERIVPQIKKCIVDVPVEHIDGMGEILVWINEFDANGKNGFDYAVEDEHYLCSVEFVWYRGVPRGFLIEMKEDTDRWNYMNLISNYNAELQSEVLEKTEHISNIQSQILVGMANMVENRDGSTGGHIKRTSEVIRILVDVIRENGLLSVDEQFGQDIVKAAPMHDLGKIAIDDDILRKPGRLTEGEFEIMKTHAPKSADLVKSILERVEEERFVKVAVNVAKYHHEKWNGGGYPEGLSGELIPLEARIMAVADVYDALVSKRCYKEPMDFEQASKVMLESMGTHFDPNLQQVFLLARERLEEYYMQA